eukprot:8390-Pelagococcus_subviridis.AAC.3
MAAAAAVHIRVIVAGGRASVRLHSVDDRERPVPKRLRARAASELPARRPRRRPRAQKQNVLAPHAHAVRLRDDRANAVDDDARERRGDGVVARLRDHADRLVGRRPVALDRERRDRPRTQRPSRARRPRPVAPPLARVRVAYRPLDVLGREVPPADDDEVFRSARHEQLAVAREPLVAGPQERAAALPVDVVRQRRAERAVVVRVAAVAPPEPGRDRRAPHPNLPDLSVRAPRASRRVHDAHLDVPARRAHAGDAPHVHDGRRATVDSRRDYDDRSLIALERRPADRYRPRRPVAHVHDALREAVPVKHRAGRIPARLERGREDRRRPRIYPLRGVETMPQRRQV